MHAVPVITSHHNGNARSARGLKSWSVQSFLAEYPDGDRKRARPTSLTAAASPFGKSCEGLGHSHVPASVQLTLPRRAPWNLSSAQIAATQPRSVGVFKTP